MKRASSHKPRGTHGEGQYPGLHEEVRANEEEEEVSAFEHLEDPFILKPAPQVARYLATRLVALTTHGIVVNDQPVGCNQRVTIRSRTPTSLTLIRLN